MRRPHPRIPKRRLTSHNRLSGRHTFKTLMKRQFSRFAVAPPAYTTVTFVFRGSVGSLEADDAIEWIEQDFAERFDAWKRMQG